MSFTKYPLCPFCSAPWTDDMVQTFHSTEVATGFYEEPVSVELRASIDIVCSSCDRLIYRKEIVKELETCHAAQRVRSL